MHSSSAQLLDLVDKISKVSVLVVGDIILDRYIWGEVERISPEAPVPVVDVKRREDRLGGAGNVARNLRCLGTGVSLCGFIGDDEEGQIIHGILEAEGIEKSGVIVDREKPTCLKTRVIAHSQQVVRIDRELRAPHSLALRQGFAAIVDTHIDKSNTIVLSDYGKGAVSDSLINKLSEATQAGRISLERLPLIVDPHPSNYAIYKNVCIAKPNRKEAEAGSGVRIHDQTSAIEAARVLMEKWQAKMVVITLGEDGLLIYQGAEVDPLFKKTVAVEVFDVSGAGDTVTALFAVALACGASASLAGDLANIGAGIVIAEVGTAAITLEALRKEIPRLAKK